MAKRRHSRRNADSIASGTSGPASPEVLSAGDIPEASHGRVTRAPSTPVATHSLGRISKGLLSLVVLWHLWGAVAEPIRFQTRGPFRPSPAADALYIPVGGYVEFMYLAHGYAFFAPDPGPNHLMEVRYAGAEGRTESRRYPNLTLDRPRLLYHRHFMLAEFLNNLHRPELPANLVSDPEARGAMAADTELYRQVKNSMVHHLSVTHGGVDIDLRRIEHRMPGLPEFVHEGVPLDDPRLYQELPEGPVAQPLSPPQLVPARGVP